MEQQLEKLRYALSFYADPVRYKGANQPNDNDDRFSNGAPYIRDVNRDRGEIARNALNSNQ